MCNCSENRIDPQRIKAERERRKKMIEDKKVVRK